MPEGKKHAPGQIVAILRRVEQGETSEAVCRSVNISETTLYRRKQQYGAMGAGRRGNERLRRRIERQTKESGLPGGKTVGTLDETRLPEKVRRQLPAQLDGELVSRGDNLFCFGLPGRGKSHFAAAVGREWIQCHQLKVLFVPPLKLVGQLLVAKRDLKLPSRLAKLARYDAVILDDLGYVQQSREGMEVLFTFLTERYEKRTVVITFNLVFSQRDQIFKNPMTTMAAIDRLVHHATILEFTGERQRLRKASKPAARRRPERPPIYSYGWAGTRALRSGEF